MFVFLKKISLMLHSELKSPSILILLILLSSACAKIGSPAGGPRDRQSPVVLKSEPENGALNFRGKEITVTFDEFVILDGINEKFMVSPPMSRKPDIVIRGKSMRVRYTEDLRDSTTYTFYFQDAIRDLNESNPINNYQFVFSTGPFIDSLSVTGNVFSPVTLDPPENTIVLLYSNPADSAVRKLIPDYITRVEANGEFRIDNVRPGTYSLYALSDADNSKNYNRKEESFAFSDSLIKITPEKNMLPARIDSAVVLKPGEKKPFRPPVPGEFRLVMFQAEKTDRYLTSSSRKVPYGLVYTLSLPPGDLEFDFKIPGAEKESWFIERTANRDTINVWLTDSSLYNRPQLETIVTYPFTDTLGITAPRTDTITMRFIAPRAPRGRVVKKSSYPVDMGSLSGQVRPDKRIRFTAPAPFETIDTSKIIFYEVSKESRTRVPYSLLKDSAGSCRYFMNTSLVPGRSYQMITDSAAFRSIYGEISDSAAYRFSVMLPEMFGRLILDITGHDGGRIIQLLDNNENLKREVYADNDGRVDFQLLEKGIYRIRVIFDLDGDHKWTTGEFDLHRQPEPASYYPKEIEIKENWEVTQPWDLKRKNYKEALLQKIKTTAR